MHVCPASIRDKTFFTPPLIYDAERVDKLQRVDSVACHFIPKYILRKHIKLRNIIDIPST